MRKNILAPSILAADFTNLGSNIKQVVAAGAEYIHVDVMDGIFVPSISFGMPVLESIRNVADCTFDVHLMIDQPERYTSIFAGCGADSITVHAESTNHLHRVIQQIRSIGIRVGVAVNPSTPLNVLDYVLDDVDMVLVMTVNPGFGGQEYIPNMTEKIRTLRQTALSRGMNLDIQVDGGIKESTIREVLEAGANIIVAGSAIFKGDIQENASRLLEIMKEYKEF